MEVSPRRERRTRSTAAAATWASVIATHAAPVRCSVVGTRFARCSRGSATRSYRGTAASRVRVATKNMAAGGTVSAPTSPTMESACCTMTVDAVQ